MYACDSQFTHGARIERLAWGMSLAESVLMRGLALLCLTGCYTGAPANRDVAHVWQGRSTTELETRWGAPQARDRDGDATVATWTFERTHIELPSGDLHV